MNLKHEIDLKIWIIILLYAKYIIIFQGFDLHSILVNYGLTNIKNLFLYTIKYCAHNIYDAVLY